jgi:hypothetical protein
LLLRSPNRYNLKNPEQRRFRQEKEMKIRFVIALALFAAVAGFAVSPDFGQAKSTTDINSKCAIASFQKAYEESKAVFTGEVVGEDKEGDERTFDFKVEKYWKGADAKNIEIVVYETARFQAWFKKGGKYLIYAEADEDGKLRVGRCSRSRDIDYAEEDLQKLGKGKSPR